MTAGVASGYAPRDRVTPARRLARQVRYQAPAIVVFFAVLVLWEVIVAALNLRQFILPRPSAIATAFGAEWQTLQAAARNTLYEALGGLAIGVTLGVVTAFAVSRWGRVRDALLPIAVGASAVPIIAAAPIMSNWFGILNPFAKMAIVILLVYFPMLINVSRGLAQVEPAAIELMQASAASEGQVLRKVRIPNALPYFFTALKVCTTLSLIGAVVAEYFGGSSDVLGRVIVQSSSRLRFDITWAAIAVAAASGIVMYLAALAAERIVIPWHASQRVGES
jgi:NitT/TauT family transport system permease protein